MLGTDSWLDHESLGLIIAAMSLPNVLPRLRPDITVIAPSDRAELIPGLMLAHQSGTFPRLAGIVLTGGYPIPDSIIKLSEGVVNDLPIVSTELGTYKTAERLDPGPRPDAQVLDARSSRWPAGCSPSTSIKTPCSARSTSPARPCVRR